MIPIEQLNAWSLNTVRQSLDKYNSYAKNPPGYNAFGVYNSNDAKEYYTRQAKEGQYRRGDGWGIEDEYRYLVGEEGFKGVRGVAAPAPAPAPTPTPRAAPAPVSNPYKAEADRLMKTIKEMEAAKPKTIYAASQAVQPSNLTIAAAGTASKQTGTSAFKRRRKTSSSTNLRTIQSVNV
jgi:hypothetical protein